MRSKQKAIDINALVWAVALLPALSQAGFSQVVKPKSSSSADRGHAQLETTLNIYQNMNTYQGHSLVDLNLLEPGGEVQNLTGESTSIWYKRPNKLAVKLASNKVSVDVYCDGKTFSVYHSDSRKYFSVPAPGTLADVAKVLHEKAGIDAILDPLFFLSNPTIPPSLATVYFHNSNVPYNGHTANVLLCEWRVTDALKKSNFFFQDQAHWLVTLDQTSSLLLQTEVNVPGTAIIEVKDKKGKRKASTMRVTFQMKHRVVDGISNKDIPDSVFVFTPPKGATRQKDMQELVGTSPQNTAAATNEAALKKNKATAKNANSKDGGNNGIKF